MANNKGRRRRFGAVRQLPSKKWQARYPGPDGKLLTADRTFATKTAAEEWLTDTESEMRRGDWIDPRGDMVFGTYATAWIKERPNLRPRTRELYSILLRLHLMPTFGKAAIPAIKEADVRRWRATRLEGGLGLSTTAKSYRLMRAIMNTAVDDGLIRRNPCGIKGGGDEKAPERPILTLEQVFTLADGVGPRYRALVLLAAFGSLRWGELAALRRDHVDLDAGTIRIEVSAIEDEQRQARHRSAEVGRRQAHRYHPSADPPRSPSARGVVRREGG
ncbi:site-specific integrase [Embleya sp. NBC_00888]|uniref:site-specific integrase n=1 Tax=Embleya sp. NBC_00888 TaxID=2975960 RepID=UPI00387001A0|nr:site-specific integrase [Embleya sp. NBC_00888]